MLPLVLIMIALSISVWRDTQGIDVVTETLQSIEMHRGGIAAYLAAWQIIDGAEWWEV